MLEKLPRISLTFQNFFNWPRKLQDYITSRLFLSCQSLAMILFPLLPMILCSNIVNLDSDAKAIAESSTQFYPKEKGVHETTTVGEDTCRSKISFLST